MKNRVVLLRKCVGCGERKTKDNFIRIVKSVSSENEVEIFVCKKNAQGRGAYLCKDKECFKKAKKNRRLEKSFSCRVESSVYDDLERMVNVSAK